MTPVPHAASLAIALMALTATIGFAHAGLTLTLGAHPFWSARIAWIGAPVGAMLAVILARGGGWRAVIGFAILTAATLALAHYGKTAFAASYAEDRLAGRVWYFGWIGTCAGFAAMLTAAGHRLFRR